MSNTMNYFYFWSGSKPGLLWFFCATAKTKCSLHKFDLRVWEARHRNHKLEIARKLHNYDRNWQQSLWLGQLIESTAKLNRYWFLFNFHENCLIDFLLIWGTLNVFLLDKFFPENDSAAVVDRLDLNYHLRVMRDQISCIVQLAINTLHNKFWIWREH